MDRTKYLIAVAGGSGTRMGGDLPKQFLEIGGKAILHHTIGKFIRAIPGLRVITVLSESGKEYWRNYCYAHNFTARQTLVTGGITRFHSVKNALEKVPEGSIVAVHDGVRPLLSESLITRLFDQARTLPATVPVVPLVDSIKVLDYHGAYGNLNRSGKDVFDNTDRRPDLTSSKQENPGPAIYKTVPGESADRSRLFAAQTPQIFHSEVLKEAYNSPYSTIFTDDASVVESCGVTVYYTDGEKYNIKITTPEDLKIAEALMIRVG